MTIGLIVALAMQTLSGTEAANPRRVNEELYYLGPYVRGVYSCNRSVARQQGRIFRRKFERRIETLKQKEAHVLGPDPGFDVVPQGHCTKSQVVRSTDFLNALDQFEADLTSLEAKFP